MSSFLSQFSCSRQKARTGGGGQEGVGEVRRKQRLIDVLLCGSPIPKAILRGRLEDLINGLIPGHNPWKPRDRWKELSIWKLEWKEPLRRRMVNFAKTSLLYILPASNLFCLTFDSRSIQGGCYTVPGDSMLQLLQYGPCYICYKLSSMTKRTNVTEDYT